MKRSKPAEIIRGMPTIADNVYNEQSGTLKSLGPIFGCLVPIGRIDTVKTFEKGILIAFYNSDTSEHFVRFGSDPSTLTPSSNYTEAIPIPPGQFMVLSNGPFVACVADDTSIYAYNILDDSVIK